MARIDNINNFLTDVASSIRTKTGKTDKIPASSFDTEISSITTSEDLDSELATYNTELTEQEESLSGIVEYLENKIESGEPLFLQDKTIEITENGTTNITADEGYDGLNSVEVTSNVEGAGKYAPRQISFYGYQGTELNEEIANLDISNLTSMFNMFYNCRSLTELDLSNFDTSKVTAMNSAFYYCSSLTELDLSSFDTSNVTNMSYMFRYTTNIVKLDLSSFDTGNVTNMERMFEECNNIIELDLSNFDTSNVANMKAMFYGCGSLQRLDIRNFDFSNVTSYDYMFGNSPTPSSFVPIDCEIIVKDDTAKTWVLARRSDFTNVKTVVELEG